jgi:hypothetical protein
MITGEDIWIEGKVSERLFYNTNGPLQKLLKCFWPTLHEIHIHPEMLDTAFDHAPGVITGFSGGIDSYSILADYFFAQVPQGMKITHLMYNNSGSHGSGNDGRNHYLQRLVSVSQIADHVGLPLLSIDSNLDQFYPINSYPKTHTIRNASAALCLQAGVGRFIYASTYQYSDVFIRPTFDVSHTDPITLPLLSTERVDMLSAGGEYSRVEKTIKVAQIPESFDSLDVCPQFSDNARNCSTCYKCMRTMLTLDLAGYLDRYAQSFNLELYRTMKEKYIGEILRSRDPLQREIIQYARSKKYSFSKKSQLISLIQKIERDARKIKNIFNLSL